MRRRLLAAILATVVLALVLSGTGTYLLVRRQAAIAVDESLRTEVEALAGLVSQSQQTRVPINQSKVVTGLRLEGISVLVIGPRGRLGGTLPEGVSVDDVPRSSMVPGTTRSGRNGRRSWAAATVEGANGSVVTVVITRESVPPRPPIGWFLVGGGIALIVGTAVAAWLADSLTRPLRHAQAATLRIAEGDLAIRLPEPRAGDHDEVAELTRSINSMASSLAISRGLERQFLLSVSHDLRTPLTSIRGYADAITDGTIGDPRDASKVISSEAQRLSRLVADLLDLARLDAHAFSFHLRAVPLAEVVTEAVEGFRPTAEEAGVALEVRDPLRPVTSVIDPDRLAQALANLLENGLKHAEAHLWVETVAGEAGDAVILVTDDGPGISATDLPHLFERLYVADRPPRRAVGGAGLGLAIVRELVLGMGGRVWVDSPAADDGRGARFAIALPPPPPEASVGPLGTEG